MDDLVLYDHAGSICSQMARLALVEKELRFTRHQIDIMETNQQFEPWYVALNPKAVVPTLKISERVVTDTLCIVNTVQDMPGPDLSGDSTTQSWLKDIMALHYGVLLYRNRLDPNGTARQIVARGHFLEDLLHRRPDLAALIETRLEGNRRFQALLADPEGIERHVASARNLVDRLAGTLKTRSYVAGETYSLADCFATAALARFKIHGFSGWWADTSVADYYARMKQRPSFAEAQVIDSGTERDL
ncbi:MAG: glutathione S-transferase family protein [Alphaproteobacteria bacterium]|nr:glutathione S-transferase family protein [Alphaproteobacteria bacterium]